MRILFLNFRNNPSSAVLRISEVLLQEGCKVSILSYLSLVKKENIYQVKGIGYVLSSVLFFYDIFVTRYVYANTGRLFSRNSILFSNLLSFIYTGFFKKFDLLHLHWVGHGFISSKFLRKIKNKKIVLTLHDYYFITGGCHIPGECKKYTKSCVNCPAQTKVFDLPFHNFKQKESLYKEKEIYATVPSKAMADKVGESYLGTFFKEVLVVPNPIDTFTYKSISLDLSQEQLFSKLPKDKKFILFVSNNLIDPNKGFDLLLASLRIVKNLEDICLITIGNNSSQISDRIEFSHFHFGEITSTEDMIKIYNLAYLTLVPSRFESFSQVTVEAMACGSPVIAFNSSGPSEIIINDVTGFLVESFSVENYAEKIDDIIKNENLRDSLSNESRKRVINQYSYEAIGKMMKDFYKKILNE